MSYKTNEISNPSETLSTVFARGLSLHSELCSEAADQSSDMFQNKVRQGIMVLEDATRMVSVLDIFSRNENVSDISTETLKFFLLPVLLGDLNAKLTEDMDRRLEMIKVIETYYTDFLTRVKDYGVVEDLKIPKIIIIDNGDKENDSESNAQTQTRPDLAKMNKGREEKIKMYKEKKQLELDLKELKTSVIDKKMEHRDEEAVREYYLKLIRSFVLATLEEIASYEMEKPILQHMLKVRNGEIPHVDVSSPQQKRPLKPIIITRDAVQKEVFGMGYKHLPILTIEEFYEQRVRDGWFPSPEETKKQQNSMLNRAAASPGAMRRQEEEEARLKEEKEEIDDEEELDRKRRMDEYKDDHKRGEGNRHNRS